MKQTFIAAIGGAALGVFAVTQFTSPSIAQSNDQRTTYEYLDLFGDIFERVRSEYVEDVDEKELIESAINGMLTSLDPHSSYLPPKNFEDMRVQTRGEFGGLGIEVTQEDGFVKVVAPIDDTPAAEAGMQAGDFITHLDGDSLLGLTLNEAVDLLRGPVGSEIVITIVREGLDEPFDVTLVRDTIEMRAVRSRIEGNVPCQRLLVPPPSTISCM